MILLTTKDAAARLGVSVSRIYQFITEQRLPAQKAGRDYLISAEDLKLVQVRKPGRPAKTKTAVKPKRSAKSTSKTPRRSK